MAPTTFREQAGPAVLALAVPAIFLHANYQPDVDVGLGSTTATVTLADVALVAVALVALASLRGRLRLLRPALPAWLLALALLAWIGVALLSRAGTDGYRFAEGVVTAAKFAEYGVLAPALPLLLRSLRDLAVVAWAVVAWTAAAAVVGIVQLLGADILAAWTPGRRQPSFVGHHDLAALAAIGLALATAAILLRHRRRAPRGLAPAATVAAGAAMIVSGTVVGALGFAVGAVVATAVAVRTLGTGRAALARVATLVGIVLVGVFALRGGDVYEFVRFLGLGTDREQTDIETYSQRSVLAYIGVRILADHPLLGVGWQASGTERGYGPYLDDAQQRFPNVADEAFPAPGREWGVQNAYIQAGADMGVLGTVLFTAVVLVPLFLLRRAWRARDGDADLVLLACIVWALAVAGLWVAQGVVAGIPLDAVMWAGIGLAAWCAVRAERHGPVPSPDA